MAAPKPALLLIPLAALIAAFLAGGFGDIISWHSLGQHQDGLRAWIAAAPVEAAAAYVALYTALVSLSLPLGGVMTVAGGLLFGAAEGAALAVVSATAGSSLLFLLARGILAPWVARRGGRVARAMTQELRTGGVSYLLAMRLIPVVPFWLSNLAAALSGMRLRAFVPATLLGIAPASAVLAGIGAGVGDVLAAGGQPDLSVLRAPGVLLPLLGLAALSLLPVAWRRWRRVRP